MNYNTMLIILLSVQGMLLPAMSTPPLKRPRSVTPSSVTTTETDVTTPSSAASTVPNITPNSPRLMVPKEVEPKIWSIQNEAEKPALITYYEGEQPVTRTLRPGESVLLDQKPHLLRKHVLQVSVGDPHAVYTVSYDASARTIQTTLLANKRSNDWISTYPLTASALSLNIGPVAEGNFMHLNIPQIMKKNK